MLIGNFLRIRSYFEIEISALSDEFVTQGYKGLKVREIIYSTFEACLKHVWNAHGRRTALRSLTYYQ